MNYELAKQLKEAGFPQEGDGQKHFRDGELIPFHINSEPHIEGVDNRVYIPTLEELIEAIPKNLEYGSNYYFTLRKLADDEYTASYMNSEDYLMYEEEKTAWEAVSKLYIKLNE